MNAETKIEPSMFDLLAAEFPREAIHWRAQNVTQDGKKAMALAYLDARDVMDRFDTVCGPANWRNLVEETPSGRIICTIEVFDGERWVGKTDGAGETAVEGAKGAISDALKRTAVLWGVGRYLYRLPAVWVECDSYPKNGKHYWKRWKADPWKSVPADWTPQSYGEAANAQEPPKDREKLEGPYPSMSALQARIRKFAAELEEIGDVEQLNAWLGTDEIVELEKQALRYLPGWWDTGEGLSKDFVPMTTRIVDKHRSLEMNEMPTPITAAG